MKTILTLFLATFLLVGCRTTEIVREVPVEVLRYVQRNDTLIVNTTDSVRIHEKGDTVFLERFKTVYRDRIRERVDTVTNTVQLKQTVTVEKKVKVNKWGWTDTGFIVLLLGGLLYVFRKFLPL